MYCRVLKNAFTDVTVAKMFSRTSFELRVAILSQHQNGVAFRKIPAALIELGFATSFATASHVIREFQLEQEGHAKVPRKLAAQNLRPKRIDALIRKVDKITNKANPPTQKQMALGCGVSRQTTKWILTEHLGTACGKRRGTHTLSEKQAEQCLDRRPGF